MREPIRQSKHSNEPTVGWVGIKASEPRLNTSGAGVQQAWNLDIMPVVESHGMDSRRLHQPFPGLKRFEKPAAAQRSYSDQQWRPAAAGAVKVYPAKRRSGWRLCRTLHWRHVVERHRHQQACIIYVVILTTSPGSPPFVESLSEDPPWPIESGARSAPHP